MSKGEIEKEEQEQEWKRVMEAVKIISDCSSSKQSRPKSWSLMTGGNNKKKSGALALRIGNRCKRKKKSHQAPRLANQDSPEKNNKVM